MSGKLVLDLEEDDGTAFCDLVGDKERGDVGDVGRVGVDVGFVCGSPGASDAGSPAWETSSGGFYIL